MAALRIVERDVVLSGDDPAHAGRREARELAVMTGARRVEVHATSDLVGAVLLEQHIDHLSHHRDLTRRVWHHIGLAPAEPAHVGEECALLTPAEIAPAHAVAGSALQDRLVYVGDVL